MKKFIAVLSIFLLFTASGCAPTGYNSADNGKISIVCTVFPQYDWVKNLISGAEDKYELTLLTDKGVDIHSYQPSADDIIKIAESSLIIYTGGESDAWVKDYTKDIEGKSFINMLEAVEDDALYDVEENENDEHVWMSFDNAEEICEKISEQLIRFDPSDEELYNKNKENYENKLEALEKEYADAVDSSKNKIVVIADRFPFRYLFDEYDISYYAAFPGCSAETEASFEKVKTLSEKAESTSAVLVTDNGNISLAQTVISNTSDKNKPILSLCSMQNVKKEDIDSGFTYLTAMRDNLETLKKALN